MTIQEQQVGFSFKTTIQSSKSQEQLNIENRERTNGLPWRGQFSPQLVEFLINKYCTLGDYILDPFCGSGTVLRESARAGYNAAGTDINPAALCLARLSKLLKIDSKEKWHLISRANEFRKRLQSVALLNKGIVHVDVASSELFKYIECESERVLLEGGLLFLFRNAKEIVYKKVEDRFNRFLGLVFEFEAPSVKIDASLQDARRLNYPCKSFDYILTSPPYINVFNYHQNYRSIIESLGYKPLIAARSEVGANRKFRQNRYMTVIQYCIDMSMFLIEASRLLKDGGKMTLVLGRESNVRGVAFKNGQLVKAIAVNGLGFNLMKWNERHYLNRFGSVIYEDILTIKPTKKQFKDNAETVGRSVGVQALIDSLEYCSEERIKEIQLAVNSAERIMPSPFIESVTC